MVFATALISIMVLSLEPALDRIDEIGFSWLPAGHYSYIRYFDLGAMRNEDAWEVYSKHYEFTDRDAGLLNLPASFEDYDRVTIATAVKFSINKKWVENLQNLKITSFNKKRSELFVYQFDYVEDFIKSSIANEEMKETGEVFRDRKIYSFSRRGKSKEGGLLYGVATGMGEWLAAEEIDQVKLMLACGYGSHPNILMNDNIDEVLDLTEDLGQKWSISLHKEEKEIQLRALSQNQVNKEMVEYMREAHKQTYHYVIRSTLIEEGAVTESYIFVFEDEEYARSMKDALSVSYEGQGEAQKRSYDYKHQKSVETIEGNKVIITYVLDEEMMRLEDEAAKEWEKMQKEEQEEKAKEEDKESRAA